MRWPGPQAGSEWPPRGRGRTGYLLRGGRNPRHAEASVCEGATVTPATVRRKATAGTARALELGEREVLWLA
eukprot:scaffold336_cov384-Prasinococcus_capsulatus_cf.AAC.8